MAEYIEREAAIAAAFTASAMGNTAYRDVYDTVNRLRLIPAADVRPVVMCRECVHFQQFRPHDGFCKIDGMLWNNDFFCANGKREEI